MTHSSSTIRLALAIRFAASLGFAAIPAFGASAAQHSSVVTPAISSLQPTTRELAQLPADLRTGLAVDLSSSRQAEVDQIMREVMLRSDPATVREEVGRGLLEGGTTAALPSWRQASLDEILRDVMLRSDPATVREDDGRALRA